MKNKVYHLFCALVGGILCLFLAFLMHGELKEEKVEAISFDNNFVFFDDGSWGSSSSNCTFYGVTWNGTYLSEYSLSSFSASRASTVSERVGKVSISASGSGCSNYRIKVYKATEANPNQTLWEYETANLVTSVSSYVTGTLYLENTVKTPDIVLESFDRTGYYYIYASLNSKNSGITTTISKKYLIGVKDTNPLGIGINNMWYSRPSNTDETHLFFDEQVSISLMSTSAKFKSCTSNGISLSNFSCAENYDVFDTSSGGSYFEDIEANIWTGERVWNLVRQTTTYLIHLFNTANGQSFKVYIHCYSGSAKPVLYCKTHPSKTITSAITSGTEYEFCAPYAKHEVEYSSSGGETDWWIKRQTMDGTSYNSTKRMTEGSHTYLVEDVFGNVVSKTFTVSYDKPTHTVTASSGSVYKKSENTSNNSFTYYYNGGVGIVLSDNGGFANVDVIEIIMGDNNVTSVVIGNENKEVTLGSSGLESKNFSIYAKDVIGKTISIEFIFDNTGPVLVTEERSLIDIYSDSSGREILNMNELRNAVNSCGGGDSPLYVSDSGVGLSEASFDADYSITPVGRTYTSTDGTGVYVNGDLFYDIINGKPARLFYTFIDILGNKTTGILWIDDSTPYAYQINEVNEEVSYFNGNTYNVGESFDITVWDDIGIDSAKSIFTIYEKDGTFVSRKNVYENSKITVPGEKISELVLRDSVGNESIIQFNGDYDKTSVSYSKLVYDMNDKQIEIGYHHSATAKYVKFLVAYHRVYLTKSNGSYYTNTDYYALSNSVKLSDYSSQVRVHNFSLPSSYTFGVKTHSTTTYLGISSRVEASGIPTKELNGAKIYGTAIHPAGIGQSSPNYQINWVTIYTYDSPDSVTYNLVDKRDIEYYKQDLSIRDSQAKYEQDVFNKNTTSIIFEMIRGYIHSISIKNCNDNSIVDLPPSRITSGYLLDVSNLKSGTYEVFVTDDLLNTFVKHFELDFGGPKLFDPLTGKEYEFDSEGNVFVIVDATRAELTFKLIDIDPEQGYDVNHGDGYIVNENEEFTLNLSDVLMLMGDYYDYNQWSHISFNPCYDVNGNGFDTANVYLFMSNVDLFYSERGWDTSNPEYNPLIDPLYIPSVDIAIGGYDNLEHSTGSTKVDSWNGMKDNVYVVDSSSVEKSISVIVTTPVDNSNEKLEIQTPEGTTKLTFTGDYFDGFNWTCPNSNAKYYWAKVIYTSADRSVHKFTIVWVDSYNADIMFDLVDGINDLSTSDLFNGSNIATNPIILRSKYIDWNIFEDSSVVSFEIEENKVRGKTVYTGGRDVNNTPNSGTINFTEKGSYKLCIIDVFGGSWYADIDVGGKPELIDEDGNPIEATSDNPLLVNLNNEFRVNTKTKLDAFVKNVSIVNGVLDFGGENISGSVSSYETKDFTEAGSFKIKDLVKGTSTHAFALLLDVTDKIAGIKESYYLLVHDGYFTHLNVNGTTYTAQAVSSKTINALGSSIRFNVDPVYKWKNEEKGRIMSDVLDEKQDVISPDSLINTGVAISENKTFTVADIFGNKIVIDFVIDEEIKDGDLYLEADENIITLENGKVHFLDNSTSFSSSLQSKKNLDGATVTIDFYENESISPKTVESVDTSAGNGLYVISVKLANNITSVADFKSYVYVSNSRLMNVYVGYTLLRPGGFYIIPTYASFSTGYSLVLPSSFIEWIIDGNDVPGGTFVLDVVFNYSDGPSSPDSPWTIMRESDSEIDGVAQEDDTGPTIIEDEEEVLIDDSTSDPVVPYASGEIEIKNINPSIIIKWYAVENEPTGGIEIAFTDNNGAGVSFITYYAGIKVKPSGLDETMESVVASMRSQGLYRVEAKDLAGNTSISYVYLIVKPKSAPTDIVLESWKYNEVSKQVEYVVNDKTGNLIFNTNIDADNKHKGTFINDIGEKHIDFKKVTDFTPELSINLPVAYHIDRNVLGENYIEFPYEADIKINLAKDPQYVKNFLLEKYAPDASDYDSAFVEGDGISYSDDLDGVSLSSLNSRSEVSTLSNTRTVVPEFYKIIVNFDDILKPSSNSNSLKTASSDECNSSDNKCYKGFLSTNEIAKEDLPDKLNNHGVGGSDPIVPIESPFKAYGYYSFKVGEEDVYMKINYAAAESNGASTVTEQVSTIPEETTLEKGVLSSLVVWREDLFFEQKERLF